MKTENTTTEITVTAAQKAEGEAIVAILAKRDKAAQRELKTDISFASCDEVGRKLSKQQLAVEGVQPFDGIAIRVAKQLRAAKAADEALHGEIDRVSSKMIKAFGLSDLRSNRRSEFLFFADHQDDMVEFAKGKKINRKHNDITCNWQWL